MKTFEERYTAWIDGELEGAALTAFELELSRRASAGEARADKQDAEKLRGLLKTSLQAPAMTNVEFFSHQLSERIAAERASERRRAEPSRTAAWGGLFAWSFGRMAGLGAACLFFAAALYYGLMPERNIPARTAAKTNGQPSHTTVAATGNGTTPAVQDPAEPPRLSKGNEYAKQNVPTPTPVELEPSDIQSVKVAEQAKDTTTATPLHFKKQDVNVIWISGLEYQPNVPDEGTPAPSDAQGPATSGPRVEASVQP